VFYEKTFWFKVASKTAVSVTFVRDDIQFTIGEDTSRDPTVAQIQFGLMTRPRGKMSSPVVQMCLDVGVAELRFWEGVSMRLNIL